MANSKFNQKTKKKKTGQKLILPFLEEQAKPGGAGAQRLSQLRTCPLHLPLETKCKSGSKLAYIYSAHNYATKQCL